MGGESKKTAGVSLYPTNVSQHSHTLHPAGVQCRHAWHPPCLGPRAWQQDPLTHYPLHLLPTGPGDRTETAGQSGAHSASKAAGRGQSSPDLLLLPHHLLSFSLTLAGPPACPWLHQAMPLALGHPGTTAPTAPSCMPTDLPSPGHGAWPGALATAPAPPAPPPTPCTATQAPSSWHEASLTGLSPAPRQVL